MSASRRLYTAMAKTIAYRVSGYATDDHARQAIDLLVRDLAYDLAKDNPNFDRVKFIKACGLDDPRPTAVANERSE